MLAFALGVAAGALGQALWSHSRTAAIATAPRSAGASVDPAAAAAVVEAVADATPPPPGVVRPPAHADHKPGGVHFTYEYVAPRSAALQPIYQRVRDGDLLRQLPEIQAIDGVFMLPRPLHYVTAECREASAFYSPERDEVVACYETMQVLYERGRELAAGDASLGADYARRYLLANLRFILLHETGHALIELLDIPVTGREEDAVDQLATTLMQRFAGRDESSAQVTENLRMAANWFLARSTGQYNLDAYADAHALGEQRYFNLQCLLYGSDPARYVAIVTNGDLPPARSRGCPEEARRAGRAWLRLLLPHVAPRYGMTEDQANRYFEQQARERERNAREPYVR